MNRTQAIAFYKEITGISESMGSNAFNLVSTKENNSKTRDYQIRIVMSLDNGIRQQVTNIAKKHSLAVRTEKEETIIYTP